MFKLNDAALDVVAAARPLEPHQRDAFLQDVAAALANCGEVGPGVVHRICATVQRRHFDPPTLAQGAGWSKYGR